MTFPSEPVSDRNCVSSPQTRRNESPQGPSTGGPPLSRVGWFFSMQNRFLAPLLISSILLGAERTFGVLESSTRTALAIGTCILMEVVLGRAMYGRIPHLASAYISGISVGILIRSPFFWPYALCAAITIMSKYVLRWQGRHLWNPSNFGICAMLLLHWDSVATLSIQWGNNLWPMVIIWTLGSLIIMRLKRFHICFTYVVCFLMLSYARSLMTGRPFAASVAPLTGPMYQLFVFFMITDPKTTVRTRGGQVLVTVLVAVVEMILRLAEVIHAPYFALFLVGPAANVVEIVWNKRKAEREGRPAAPEPAPTGATT